MILTPSNAILLVMLNMLLLGNSRGVRGEGREFQGYLPAEEQRPDYQMFQYPPNYLLKEEYSECAKNPMLPLLGKGLNLLLLKLGAVGIIKAVLALIFLGFLVKLPLLLLKATVLKSFFFPLLFAPLLLNMFTSQMTQPSESVSEMKPSEGPETPEMSTMIPGMMAVTDMSRQVTDAVMEMGRQLNDNMTSVAWKSLKMFAESDECAEKISCMIGASSKDSAMESIFTRMLKYLHYSSPPVLQKKVAQIKEAFSKGSRSSTCLQEDYKCQSPELLLQYGIKKVKIL